MSHSIPWLSMSDFSPKRAVSPAPLASFKTPQLSSAPPATIQYDETPPSLSSSSLWRHTDDGSCSLSSAPLTPSPSSGLPSPTFPPARLPGWTANRPRHPSASSSRQSSRQVSVRLASLLGPSRGLNLDLGSPLDIEDILCEGDLIGEGVQLHGETVTVVHTPSSPRDARDLPAAQFEVVRKLGTGSYAVVFLVREVLHRANSSHEDDTPFDFDLNDADSPSTPTVQYGREFAIKCLSKANLSAQSLEVQMLEATIHQSLPVHPNVVTLYRTLETSSFLFLVLESVPGEDLFYFLEKARDQVELIGAPSEALCNSAISITPPTPSLLCSSQLLSHSRLRLIASMFGQMCDAVHSCHRHGVSHRDIKPENFIVTDGYVPTASGRYERRVVVKLSDFGLATTDEESADMDCGSAPYMSYECRNNCAPTYATQPADVWSLGIVLINMLYHHNPWSDTAEDLSFAMFREQGASFFVQRFPGMTNEVAEFLADRVFCVVEDGDAAQRVTAQEFGLWAKRLPAMLADDKVFSPVVASRPSFMMTQDDSTAVEADRPAEQLPVAVPTGLLTPALASPQLPPVPLSDGPIAPLEDAAEDDPSSRAASTKRRKRGTRSKSKTVSSPAPIAPPELGAARDATLDDLAAGTQDLVREISRQSKGLPLPPPPPPPLPSNNLLAPPVPALPTPRPIPVKKPSKWNVFRSAKDLASSDAHAPSQPQPRSSTPEYEGNEFGDESTPRPLGMSATAANVSSLVMGLGPAPRAPRAPPSEKSEKGAWHRGRAQEQQPVHGRGLGGATSPLGARWTGNGNVSGGGGGAASGPDHRWPGSASASGPAQADNRSERYTPSVRSRGGLYGVTADNSSNWRQSYSSTSSVATSSAYTRFSNGSVRSLSTVATTVSTGSALRSVSSIAEKPEPPAPVPKRVHPPMPATNVKRMQGIPRELYDLPVQHRPIVAHANNSPARNRATKPAPKNPIAGLDTISERPRHHGQGHGQGHNPFGRSPSALSLSSTPSVYRRPEMALSNGELDDASESPKKVQKGQINALAKMLSALKTNRGRE